IVVNGHGSLALGVWNTPTQVTVAAYNNDVATFNAGRINWSDGSVWNAQSSAPLAITVLDYIANGNVAHVIENGTGVLGFVNEHGNIVLANVTSPTQATVAAWNNDVATFSAGKINWSDGAVWTLTNSASAHLTVFNYFN